MGVLWIRWAAALQLPLGCSQIAPNTLLGSELSKPQGHRGAFTSGSASYAEKWPINQENVNEELSASITM